MRWFRQNMLLITWSRFGVFAYLHFLSRDWTYQIHYSKFLGGLGVHKHPKSVEALARSGIILHGRLDNAGQPR